MTRLCGCATCAEATEAAHGEVKRLLASGDCEIYVTGVGQAMIYLAMLSLAERGASKETVAELLNQAVKGIHHELLTAPGKYRTSGT